MSQDKKTTAKAARELLLAERLPVIDQLVEAGNKLAALRDKETQARLRRQSAEDELRQRYDEALHKGWSHSELHQLGFPAPRKRSGSAGRKQQPGTATPPPPSESGATDA